MMVTKAEADAYDEALVSKATGAQPIRLDSAPKRRRAVLCR